LGLWGYEPGVQGARTMQSWPVVQIDAELAFGSESKDSVT
jgi:hypothetical protein